MTTTSFSTGSFSLGFPKFPNPDHLRDQARDLLAAYRRREASAEDRVRAHHPRFKELAVSSELWQLSDAQMVIAREYGFASWPRLKEHLDGLAKRSPDQALQRAIRDLQEGKACILFDDESRENEGDLIVAAEKVTAGAINFLVMNGRGTLCLAITEERQATLGLSRVNSQPQDLKEPAFLNSIDAVEGVTSGVSAADRATTILRAMAAKGPGTLRSPGHVFPLLAHPEGLRARAGHTEGSVELMRRAQLQPAAVICEILNEDGTMARWSEVVNLAVEWDLALVRMSDLR